MLYAACLERCTLLEVCECGRDAEWTHDARLGVEHTAAPIVSHSAVVLK